MEDLAPADSAGRALFDARRGGAGWLTLLVVVIAGMTLAGRGTLAAPPLLAGPAALGTWAGSRDELAVVFAFARLATLTLAWYLAAVTVLGAAGRLARWRGLVVVTDRLTLPVARRLLRSTLGAGLAAASVTGGSGTAASGSQTLVAAVATIDSDEGERGDQRGGGQMVPFGEDTEVLQPFPDPDPPTQPDTWQTRHGDHLWHIAETTLQRAWGRPPTDEETTRYWTRLIERNRDVLVNPDDPDLILPGQRFELPRPGRP